MDENNEPEKGYKFKIEKWALILSFILLMYLCTCVTAWSFFDRHIDYEMYKFRAGWEK